MYRTTLHTSMLRHRKVLQHTQMGMYLTEMKENMFEISQLFPLTLALVRKELVVVSSNEAQSCLQFESFFVTLMESL